MQRDKLLSIRSSQAMVSIDIELSLYSKLSKVFALELDRDTIVGGNLNGTSREEGDLCREVFFDTSHVCRDATNMIS